MNAILVSVDWFDHPIAKDGGHDEEFEVGDATDEEIDNRVREFTRATMQSVREHGWDVRMEWKRVEEERA